LEQPKTAAPAINMANGKATITCTTEGASIGYKIVRNGKEPDSWAIYSAPITVPEDSELKVVAHRIGYKPSK